jgi:inward rectifier potassium channel
MLFYKKSDTPTVRRQRLVPRGDGMEVIRVGQSHIWFSDLYVKILEMNWGAWVVLVSVLYLFSNLVFADLYFFNEGSIENARPGSFGDMFFFSVQTMATIGYGRMVPIGMMPNIIVTIEALWGFTFFAFVTGLAFTRFSRPTARLLFSEVAVISNYEGTPHLKIRLANQRTNRIVDATAHLYLLRTSTTLEGFKLRRFYDLPLVRDHVPLLQLSWTLMYPIDGNSPLYGATPESLVELEDEIIVSVTGLDETMSQEIHARYSYIAHEIICNADFEDVLTRHDNGRVRMDYNLFHAYRPVLDVGQQRKPR